MFFGGICKSDSGLLRAELLTYVEWWELDLTVNLDDEDENKDEETNDNELNIDTENEVSEEEWNEENKEKKYWEILNRKRVLLDE